MKTRKQILIEVLILIILILVIFSFFGASPQNRQWFFNEKAVIKSDFLIDSGYGNKHCVYRILDYQTGKIIYIVGNKYSSSDASITVTNMGLN